MGHLPFIFYLFLREYVFFLRGDLLTVVRCLQVQPNFAFDQLKKYCRYTIVRLRTLFGLYSVAFPKIVLFLVQNKNTMLPSITIQSFDTRFFIHSKQCHGVNHCYNTITLQNLVLSFYLPRFGGVCRSCTTCTPASGGRRPYIATQKTSLDLPACSLWDLGNMAQLKKLTVLGK